MNIETPRTAEHAYTYTPPDDLPDERGLVGYWKREVEAVYGTALGQVFDVKRRKRLYTLFQRQRALDVDLRPVITWSIHSWDGLMRGTFRWMTTPPASPDVWFFVNHADRFLQAYAERERAETEIRLEHELQSRLARVATRETDVRKREMLLRPSPVCTPGVIPNVDPTAPLDALDDLGDWDEDPDA